MTLVTHILATTAGIQLLNLDEKGIILALIFGVAIDLDHVLKVPSYLKENKFKYKRHFPWRTFLQEPISFLWIIPICLILGTIIPIIFFSLHLLLDYCTNYAKKPFYPFSNYSTKGYFTSLSGVLKEGFVVFISLFGLIIGTVI